ncbi:hypothetical protein DY000_02060116 [Brassica cretica]|uniref:Uncharacterized protein n=1 Tax=Brassica cretica TaxID=69181 RepID=A0ABQ7ATH9_BRACR|nr:hypothetical protein DY000_02060116 [Brassica cretica]
MRPFYTPPPRLARAASSVNGLSSTSSTFSEAASNHDPLVDTHRRLIGEVFFLRSQVQDMMARQDLLVQQTSIPVRRDRPAVGEFFPSSHPKVTGSWEWIELGSCLRKCHEDPEVIFGCWGCPRHGDYVRAQKSFGNPEGNPEVVGEPKGSPLDPEIIFGTRRFFFRSWDHDWSPVAMWEPEDSSIDPEIRFGSRRPYGNPEGPYSAFLGKTTTCTCSDLAFCRSEAGHYRVLTQVPDFTAFHVWISRGYEVRPEFCTFAPWTPMRPRLHRGFRRATVDVPLFDKGLPGSEVSGDLIQLAPTPRTSDYLIGSFPPWGKSWRRLTGTGLGGHPSFVLFDSGDLFGLRFLQGGKGMLVRLFVSRADPRLGRESSCSSSRVARGCSSGCSFRGPTPDWAGHHLRIAVPPGWQGDAH